MEDALPHFFELLIADRSEMIKNIKGMLVIRTRITPAQIHLRIPSEMTNVFAYERTKAYQHERLQQACNEYDRPERQQHEQLQHAV